MITKDKTNDQDDRVTNETTIRPDEEKKSVKEEIEKRKNVVLKIYENLFINK